MKYTHLPYIQAVAALSQDSVVRTRICAAAVAVVTAYVQALPSAPVELPEAYYTSICLALAKGEVGEYNEQAVLDVQSALSLTHKFWMMRYNSVHQAALTPPKKGAFLSSLTGIARFFSDEEITFLNDYAEDIFMIVMAIQKVKRTVAKEETPNVIPQ
jgi:hypothetical protein